MSEKWKATKIKENEMKTNTLKTKDVHRYDFVGKYMIIGFAIIALINGIINKGRPNFANFGGAVGATIAGSVSGLLPLYVSMRMNAERIGKVLFFVCIIAGGLGGIILAVLVALISSFGVIIWNKFFHSNR